MSFLRYAFGANYGRFYQKLREIAAREHRNTAVLTADFLRCFVRYGCGLSDYLNYELWRKTAAERREYVTIKDTEEFYARVSPDRYKNFFSLKDQFMTNFADYTGRAFFVPAEDNLPALEDFLRDRAEVMVKPVNGLGGHGVHKRKTGEIGGTAAFHKELLEQNLFVEEVIVQHPELARLCPSSVNTVRVMTVSAGDCAQLLYAGLRVGAGGDVDNFHAGGMAVHVNLDTGVLEGGAVNKSCQVFDTHPTTGIRFDGVRLPMWDQVKRLCLKASFVNPHIHVVGWDVAITPDGPVFVEGNRRPGFDIVQMTSRRGRRDILRTVDGVLKDAWEGTV